MRHIRTFKTIDARGLELPEAFELIWRGPR